MFVSVSLLIVASVMHILVQSACSFEWWRRVVALRGTAANCQVVRHPQYVVCQTCTFSTCRRPCLLVTQWLHPRLSSLEWLCTIAGQQSHKVSSLSCGVMAAGRATGLSPVQYSAVRCSTAAHFSYITSVHLSSAQIRSLEPPMYATVQPFQWAHFRIILQQHVM